GKWNKEFFVKDLEEEEKELIKILERFPEVSFAAIKDLRPHYICNYAYELASTFDKFYEKCPVLKTEEKKKNFRLILVKATKVVLENCLRLIRIEIPERM
ncbi:MAG: DALR anticodon-binding domain-containing protein, partial [Candidatus Aenigmatarchaeota archaeon]